jgi:alkylhydroperoxidase/carboxymuconolactone decarboxylase family protein YurZ
MEACADPGGGERGMIPYFDCQSYVLGVVDSYRLLKDNIAKEKQMCLPENVTTREIVKLIYITYRQEPFPQNRSASDVILEVLKKKYPCSR